MRQFHPLKVTRLTRETDDSIRVGLAVPEQLRDEYLFLPGQHVPIEATIDGRRTRRTYSICSTPGRPELEIGVRIQPGGRFSTFVAERLAVGDELKVMPPIGQFHAEPDPARARTCVAFAAGSGITPILSILTATLESEPGSRVILFYGNRRQLSTMFIDDLYALKNRFPERVQLHFLFSREEQEFPVMSGRLDADKVAELYRAFAIETPPDDVYVCGPDTMIQTVTDALVRLGVAAERIHAERFGAPRKTAAPPPAELVEDGSSVDVTVVMDGHRRSFAMPKEGAAIVDAAAARGVELPYSCKGGVCATCRTHLASGEVRMDQNYGLEPWEVEKGYILACQSHPLSDEIVLDYDRT